MTTEKVATRKPIGLDESVLVEHFWYALPARVIRRDDMGSQVRLCVILTEYEDTGLEPYTLSVEESRVFRYDEIDRYEPDGHSLELYAYRQRVLKSVRRLLRNSVDGLGVDEVVGGDAASMLDDGNRCIEIGRPREYPQFRMLVYCTMRGEVPLRFERLIVRALSYLPAGSVRLAVVNEPFADPQLLADNGIVWLTWRSRKDDKALARAIRIAVAQQRSALAA